MQTPSNPNPNDPHLNDLNRDDIRDAFRLIRAAHRDLFVASTILSYPGLGTRYQKASWQLQGFTQALAFALGQSLKSLQEIENELLNEDEDNANNRTD